MEFEIEISRLGAQGDGVAEDPEGPIFVPFTLPGERVKVAVDPESDHARLVEILEPSRKRVAPVCPHFGECGGCALQHMEADAYLSWKRDQVVAALRSRGLDAKVEEVRPVPLGSRRRASLAIGRGATGAVLGYHRVRSHELIDIEVCPVLSFPLRRRCPGSGKHSLRSLEESVRPKWASLKPIAAWMLWLMVSVPLRQPWPRSRGEPLRLA
jgi:23S rRNA (uracil1939-C5)-methyltransferase